MKVIGTYTVDQYFDVSIWLAGKGYRIIEHYYSLADTTTSRQESNFHWE